VVARPAGAVLGFVGPVPVQAQDRPGVEQVSAWGLYCPGVVGMGRSAAPNSANSEFFLMRDAWPSLDKRYTPVGRVVLGLTAVRSLKTGEPVKNPDVMTKVRVLADIPERERPVIEVQDTRGPAFQAQVAEVRRRKGADFSACDLTLKARIVSRR
jgi:peptidylprolyl isomerase